MKRAAVSWQSTASHSAFGDALTDSGWAHDVVGALAGAVAVLVGVRVASGVGGVMVGAVVVGFGAGDVIGWVGAGGVAIESQAAMKSAPQANHAHRHDLRHSQM